MTQSEFMKRYHTYQTSSREEAQRECAAVTAQADGFVPMVQAFDFGGGRVVYGLMAQSASDFLASLGIKTDRRA
jgi:hypothetical protein